MNANEPYGWHCFDDDNDFLLMNGKGFSKPDSSWNKVIPLYTHPAKTLTDDGIADFVRNAKIREQAGEE